MMKTKVKVAFIVLFCFVLMGCGVSKEKEDIEPLGLVPSRIENIQNGGTIPEGCQAKVICESDLKREMFWGTWVLDSTQTEEPNGSFVLETGESAKEFKCFPSKMRFNPAWAGVSLDPGFLAPRYKAEERLDDAKRSTSLFMGTALGEDVEFIDEDNPIGYAAESLGLGIGVIELEQVESSSQSETEIIEIITAFGGHARKVVYTVNEDILALGITEEELYDEFLSETDITEINYKIDWEGYKLTLTYNGESAVYVPEQMIDEYWRGMELVQAGLPESYEAINNILGITVLPEDVSQYDSKNTQNYSEDRIMFNIHEGYVSADVVCEEDGSVQISSSKGDTYEYKYFYSGDSLTLKSENQTAVYSIYNYALEAGTEAPSYSFDVNGDNMKISVYEVLGDLVEYGFDTNVNLSQPIASCQVTEEIILTYQGAELVVKAGNPYKETIELRDAPVCYYRIEDFSGVIEKGDGTQIGKTPYEKVDFLYAPYEKTDNKLRYKGISFGIITSMFGIECTHALEAASGLEVIYNFENGILKNIEIEEPILLYNGLQDNVDNTLLAQMEPTEFAGVIEVRDTILDRLKSAFAEAAVDVKINEASGEILMDNDVLFAVDKYDLSSEGKQYIDNFMGVYASVITAEEFSDYISEIRFEGHTDSSGSYGYNLILSQNRADAVLDYCINSVNNGLSEVQKEKIEELSSTIGYSSSDPVLTENGNEDMDASRRVAIKFFINIDKAKSVSTAEKTTESVKVETMPQEQYQNQADENGMNSNMQNYVQMLGDFGVILMGSTDAEPFIWNLPLELETFTYEGWNPDIGLDANIEPGYSGCMLEKGNSSCYALLHNESNSAKQAGDCTVFGVAVYDAMNTYIALKGGITLDSSIEEITAVYGDPYEVTEEKGYQFAIFNSNQTIHLMTGLEKGIFYLIPGYTFGGGNFFNEM